MKEFLPVLPVGGSRGSAPSLVPKLILLLICIASLSGCTERTVLSMRHGPTPALTAVAPPAKAEESVNSVKIWFLKEESGSLRLVPVVRNVSGDNKMRECLAELLYGPTSKEAQAGLGSEIPRGTVLIGLTQRDGEIELNLSKRFASGGEDSLVTRLEQLRRTVAGAAENRKVYLDVEGRRLTAAGGDGLEVKQPINM